MKFSILFLVSSLMTVSLANGQNKPSLYTLQSPYERYNYNLFTVRLSGAQPLGSFSNDYIDKFSLENYTFSLESVQQGHLSFGGEVGYSYFGKRMPRAIYSSGNQDISAVQTRSLSQYTIHGFANYHLTEANSRIRPYVQLSAGGGVVNYTTYYGSLGDQYRKFKLGYGVGIGSKFLFKSDGSIGADVRIKYNYTGLKYDYIQNGVSSLNASIGIFYRWW